MEAFRARAVPGETVGARRGPPSGCRRLPCPRRHAGRGEPPRRSIAPDRASDQLAGQGRAPAPARRERRPAARGRVSTTNRALISVASCPALPPVRTGRVPGTVPRTSGPRVRSRLLHDCENALDCLHGEIARHPASDGHRSGGPGRVPGRDRKRYGRRDHRAAEGAPRGSAAARRCAVRRRPADTVHPQTVIEYFGAGTRPSGRPGSFPPFAPARSCSAAPALGDELGPRPPRGHRRAQGRDALQVAALAPFGSLAQTPRGWFRRPGGRSGSSGPSSRAPSARQMAACRRWPTGPPRAAGRDLLTEWQVLPDDRRPAGVGGVPFLVKERLRDEGVDVAPDGTLRGPGPHGEGDRIRSLQARGALVRRPDGREDRLLDVGTVRAMVGAGDPAIDDARQRALVHLALS